MNIVKKIQYIFDRKQKVKLLFLTIIMLLGSFMELIGVAAVMPFVNVVANPMEIHSNLKYNRIYTLLGFTNDTGFILAFAIGIIILYIVKNVYIIFMNYFQFRFTYKNQQTFVRVMMNCYMKQPYLFHVSKNVSELTRNVSSDVQSMFAAVLAIIQLLNEGFICSLLLVYLLVLDKTITISLAIMLSCFAGIFLKVIRKQTISLGKKNRINAALYGRSLRQAFEGIKEIKIANKEQFYINDVVKHGNIGADISINMQTVNALPKPLFEAICISAMMAVVALKIIRGVQLAYFIPVLSAFAVSAFRLLPSASRITTFINTITYNKAAIDNVYNDLQEVEDLMSNYRDRYENKDVISFRNEIRINDISFAYSLSSENVLENVSLKIEKNTSVALIGPSGAGKTTLADIILGLLEPQSGTIFCDDINVYEKPYGWHKLLGYIPQTIYLIDDTIRNNILFGISEENLDDEKLWEAVNSAQLGEFVRSLEKGLDTVVGERGVRLSGGQRQRIGIARALYNNPQILILDEATSALDNETETAVMESIDALHGSRTMIIIAHRLSTIRNCDSIYKIYNHKAILCEKNEVFK